ncbi:D-2-hydroxyacid dehydrogenase [Limosilactobacillus fastidiosus]|nr:D-2-hydroxyacid dehydrogenase [Limosilactobacillus fastidiosus]MCD7084707.1 D-2-hydroxyacid dehydrogenase [Limosilactobacillus fastidiosus]MCD7085794.1 D-2-hydroxyacid dehydrogenase [Limosilactobacillus fastidiosus]MCD7113871.1 D-2-hydroxyacid dehydrogenase [Limosilactobacillus fastidiosus]MCD7115703.1 D-2-hydroxyacid dehydrogenase [Limosilactobacillus fastidiosus]
MKLIMFGVDDKEVPYAKEWAEKTGNEVKMVEEQLNSANVDLVDGYDGISVLQTSKIDDPAIYAKLKQFGIKQLSTRTAGYDVFDLELAKKNGLKITNVSIYSPRAIAEMGLTHAMYLLRKIGEFKQRMVNDADFRWSEDLVSGEIYNQTVAIVGLGHIGGATAQIYKALGARVIAVTRENSVVYAPYVDEFVDLETALKEADIITIHVPLTTSTENMFAAPQFKKMKKKAILINMARGKVVNTADLIDALRNNEIGGAGLDTLGDETTYFSKKVAPEEVPADFKELVKMPNVVVTPHVAFMTDTAVRNMVLVSLNDTAAIVEGKSVKNEVRLNS